MAAERERTAWVSPLERVVTPEELAEESTLHETDRRIGDASAQRYEGGPTAAGDATPLVVRAPAALARRIAHTAPGRLARKVARRARRELWRRVRRGPRPVRSSVTGIRLEVIPEPRNAAEANAFLQTSEATHLVIVRHDGELLPEGVERAAAVLVDPNVHLLYGDSRRVNGIPGLAPAPSRFRLREEDYLGPVVIVSVAAVRGVGGFRPEADDAHLLDLALRLGTENARRVAIQLGVGVPIDRPVGERASAALAVVEEHLQELGIEASVTEADGVRDVRYRVAGTPLVSIIIPTRGGSGEVSGEHRCFVVEAVRGLVERTSWTELEIVIVADAATPQAVIDELGEIAGDRLVLVRWSEPFNFSAKMNRGAVAARGEYLLMLNDDIEVVNHDWLDRMLGLAQQDGIGEVGALLFFEDGSVQHLGHIHDGGAAGHVGFGVMPGAAAPLPRLAVTREASGVTAACALVSTRIFAQVGGFSTEFPGNYNDVDLSLKIREAGHEIVCSGAARLYHFESRTRDATVLDSEFDALHRRWWSRIQTEEYARGPLNLVP